MSIKHLVLDHGLSTSALSTLSLQMLSWGLGAILCITDRLAGMVASVL